MLVSKLILICKKKLKYQHISMQKAKISTYLIMLMSLPNLAFQ